MLNTMLALITVLFALSVAYYIALKLFQVYKENKEELHYFSLDFYPKNN